MDTPIPYTLTDPPTDFEGTARAMRGDLRAAGWTEVTTARVERWRSPDHKRELVMVTMGRVLTATGAVIPVERIGHELAAQLVALGETHVTAMTAWLSRLRQRVVTRGHQAAKGAA